VVDNIFGDCLRCACHLYKLLLPSIPADCF
jgi:hypothetical protein